MTDAAPSGTDDPPAAGNGAALVAALDRLVPAVDDLPAAGAMGLLPGIERMARAHPHYGRALSSVATALSQAPDFVALDGGSQDERLRGIEAAMPLDFAVLLEMVYIAYYSRPEVHARIGWRTGPLQPLGFEVKPFDNSALDIVRKRPPFWRPA